MAISGDVDEHTDVIWHRGRYEESYPMSVPSEYEYFGFRNRGRCVGAPNYNNKKLFILKRLLQFFIEFQLSMETIFLPQRRYLQGNYGTQCSGPNTK
jgi:hypothetical protein